MYTGAILHRACELPWAKRGYRCLHVHQLSERQKKKKKKHLGKAKTYGLLSYEVLYPLMMQTDRASLRIYSGHVSIANIYKKRYITGIVLGGGGQHRKMNLLSLYTRKAHGKINEQL